MSTRTEEARTEAIAWEKVANIKKLISQYYEAEEKMASIKAAAEKQIEDIQSLSVQGLPQLSFP